MAVRRTDATVAAALAGAIVALDALWKLLVGSTGRLAYALVDEPAHLATCALALLALAALSGGRLSRRFVFGALAGSVAIDVDHIPGYLGWHVVSGALPRPYSHSLVVVAALLALGCLARRSALRQVALGLAFGVSTHLLRDLATGPGVPLLWPLSDEVVSIPYVAYAGLLGAAVISLAAPQGLRLARLAAGVSVALAAMALVGWGAGPAGAAGRTVSIGGFVSGADQYPSMIDEFSHRVGRQEAVVVSYKNWSQAPFVYEQLDGIWNHGAVPMITWEPWEESLQGIAEGAYDGYVRAAAEAAAAWNRPLFVRFGQEMNGSWFPWSGNPAAYKAAWRHLVGVFRAAGATKVRWVWTPYANNGWTMPFKAYFPGGKWVDWVGFDVINWGGGPSQWSSFAATLGPSYRQLKALTSRPMILAEAGSGEVGGNKARWVSRMLRRNVPRMRRVRAVCFWSEDDPGKGDLRVQSSPGALAALRSALRQPLYDSSRRSLLATPAWLGR